MAPVLPQGLLLEWSGELVSRPYLEMTVGLMRHFGAEVAVDTSHIRVSAKPYRGGSLTVEGDWTAASYVAARVACAETGTQVWCPTLTRDSLQGDRQLVEMMQDWGVETEFAEGGARFRKTPAASPALWEYDFTNCPDLAQTFSVLAAFHGTTLLLEGLQTLLIKETDRVAALKSELAKVGVSLAKLPGHFSPGDPGVKYLQEGRAEWQGKVNFATYDDHRMAMSLALLSLRGEVELDDVAVVAKSWPGYWEGMGFSVGGGAG